MKILQVITSLQMGGAEKLVVELSKLFIEANHQVDVLVFKDEDTILKQVLIQEGINVIGLSKDKSVYHPSHIKQIASILKKNKYDIVHTHNTACQFFVAIAKSIGQCPHTQFITTEHNTTNRRRNIIGFKAIDQWMYKQYDAIASISDKATENLKQFIGGKYNIKTIFNGINLEAFINAKPLSPNQIPNYSPNDIIVSMVAGFREQKDQDTLIRALRHLPNNYKVWLIGDGIRRSELENLTENENLSARVVFWGIQSNIPSILKSSDIIVMSSHWEGLSLSSIEGMASGKPFIASNVDGLYEITKQYGILFPHQDENTLAKEIINLQDETYYKSIALRCLKRAQEYDIKNTYKQYLNLYQTIKL